MTIKVGDRLPAGTLWEFIEEETPGCSVGQPCATLTVTPSANGSSADQRRPQSG